MRCQCHQCNRVFDYFELSQDVKEKHVTPCCKSSYTIIDFDSRTEWYFNKFLYVNKDPKYYEYKDKYDY